MSVAYKYILSFGAGNRPAADKFLVELLRYQGREEFWFTVEYLSDFIMIGGFGKGNSREDFLKTMKQIEWKYDFTVQLFLDCDHDDRNFVEVDWKNEK